MNYPLPKDSQTAYLAHQNKSPQNSGLIFDRFAPDWRNKSTLKKDGLEDVQKATQKADPKLLTAWQTRWKAIVVGEYGDVSFTLKTDWRLIAGLGRKGPLEVGFTFNCYGFPIIPGSSLKGLARAWGLFQIVEKLAEKLAIPIELWPQLEKALQGDWEDDKDKKWRDWVRQCLAKIGQPELWQALEVALQKKGEEGKKQQRENLSILLKALGGDEPAQWRTIFGAEDEAGQAIFFDAIPAQFPTLKLDIMNPHYPQYYEDKSGRVAPTDWQSPRPVYFLTVAPDIEFCFAVGWRGAKENESLRQVAEAWLKAGLTELGVGSKTSAGYGYFRLAEEKAEPESSSIVKREIPRSIPEPAKPAKPIVWRSGTIVGSIDTSRTKRGKVEDTETKRVYEFHISAIKGDTPGKRARVEFVLQDGKVVAVRRR